MNEDDRELQNGGEVTGYYFGASTEFDPSKRDSFYVHRCFSGQMMRNQHLQWAQPARGRGGGPESAQHEWMKLRLTRIAEKLG